MKITYFLFSLVVITGLIESCSTGECGTKEDLFKTFETFHEDLETKDRDYLKDNQGQIEDRYKEIVNSCYKKFRKDLSLEERQDFWKRSVAVYFTIPRTSFDLSFGSEKDEDFDTYVKDELNDLLEESKDDFEKIIMDLISENLVPELNDMMQQLKGLFGDELNKIGDELKEAGKKLSEQ